MQLGHILLVCLAAIFCTVSGFPQQQPPPLNNNSGFRKFSDGIDHALGWGYDDAHNSKIRGALHGGYHEIQSWRTGNPREHERAKDQRGVVTGGRRDNLERYDREHYGSGK